MEALEKEIMDEIDKDVQKINKAATNLRPVPTPEKKQAPLTEQLAVLEKYGQEFRERVRKERQAILAKYDRDLVDITNSWDEKIGDMIAKMEQEKKEEIASLAQETAIKISENEQLTKRMG